MSLHPTVARAPDCDTRRFEELYREWREPVVNLCRRQLGLRHDAEAVAQEALLRAWLSWDRFAAERPFGPWVVTIARRLCVNELRRSGRRVPLADDQAAWESEACSYEQDFDRVADAELLHHALKPLPLRYRRLLLLRDGEGWSYDDIARFEGVTIDAVKGSLRRARVVLRRLHDAADGVLGGFGLGSTALGWLRRATSKLIDRTERVVGLLARQVPGHDIVAAAALVLLVASTAPSATVPDPREARPSDARPGASLVGWSANDAGARRELAAPVSGPEAARWEPPDSPAPAPVRAVDPAAEGTDFRYTASPAYTEDHTVFAAGAAHRCAPGGVVGGRCGVVLKSTDGGTTWARLESVGAELGRVLLPPSYPQDPRLFIASSTTLSVSTDGGTTFRVLTPVPGPATMSPLFSAGDARIVFALAQSDGLPLPFEFHDGDAHVQPLHLPLPVRATPQSITFGPSYAQDRSLLVSVVHVDGVVPGIGGATGRSSRVYSCTPTACSQVLDSDAPAAYAVEWSPRSANTAFAWTSFRFMRSVDGGRSFRPAPGPFSSPSQVLDNLTAGPDGRLFATLTEGGTSRTDLWSSHDDGETWSLLSSGPGMFGGELVALADGALLASPPRWAGNGILCSVDGGRTWAHRCGRDRSDPSSARS